MNKNQILEQIQKIEAQTSLLDLSQHKVLNKHLIAVPVYIKESGVTTRAAQFEDRPEVGLVVGVAEDVEGVKKGDVIFFGKYSTTQITHDGIQYQILREEDIYCVA